MFDSSVTNLSDAIRNDVHLNIYVITTENLKNIKEKDFLDSSIIDDLKYGEIDFSLHIFSINDMENLKDLKKHVQNISIYCDYSEEEPKKQLLGSSSINGDVSDFNIISLIEFRKFYSTFNCNVYQVD